MSCSGGAATSASTTSRSNSGPIVAATVSASRVSSETRVRRRRMTSATLSGTPIDSSAAACAAAPASSTSRLDERAQRLLHEERVALRLLAQPAHELRARRRVEPCGDERVGLALAEAVEHEAVEAPLAPQVGDQLGQRVVVADLDVADEAEHHQARRVGVAQEMAQQQQRRLVGPVQVVDHEQQRRALGRAPHEAGDRLEQAIALRLGVLRGRALAGPGGGARLGQDAGELLEVGRGVGSAISPPWRSSWRSASMNGW